MAIGAPTQCSNPWRSLSSTPGVFGGQRHVDAATVWDRDGAGPQPALVVVAGDFTIAGSVYADRIAAFDPVTSTWSALGQGLGGQVLALQPLPNGDLVAAGVFGIVRFDGTNWWPLATGIPGHVGALAILPNGDLVAGGFFSSVSGVPASGIARWNGTTWAALGAGITGWLASVRALAVLPNGDLVAGGNFTTAGGIAASNIARWDGSAWAAMAAGLDGTVNALRTRSNGELVACGSFDYSGSSAGPWLNHVASWNGTAWSPLGSGVAGSAWTLAELANGNVAIGCDQSPTSLLLWDGTAWLPLGAPGDDAGTVRALITLPNGDLVACGQFARIGGIGAGCVARWNGAGWSTLGSGLTGMVRQVAELGDGSVVGFGNFAVGQSRNLGLWTGAQWLPFPVPLAGVTCIQRLPNGNLLAAGTFPGPGGGNNLAQWNGTSWSTYAPGLVGAGLSAQITDLTVLPNGDVAACGSFSQCLVVWNGALWSSPGTPTAPVWQGTPTVTALTVTTNGDLVVAGNFTAIGGVAATNIARWNGTTWAPLGSGPSIYWWSSSLLSLCSMGNGDVVVGGLFPNAGGVSADNIARWNGTAWASLGTGLGDVAHSLVVLPNGDLVAGGNFPTAGGTTVNHVARWNGSTWSAFGAGTDLPVHSVAVRANGDLLVGGEFLTASGSMSPFFAEITTTCPATAVVGGPGCTGAGGPNVLTATALPWLGSTFRARATGLPPLSFALIASGVTPISLPLSALFPQGLPGCTAWVLADVIEVALPAAGAVTTQVVVPNAASLVGAPFHQQVLPFVFDPSGNLIELTGTNALTMTLGRF
ncbi:MAG: hypothetical protein WAT39_17145 [Planctomycetota bacterium]